MPKNLENRKKSCYFAPDFVQQSKEEEKSI